MDIIKNEHLTCAAGALLCFRNSFPSSSGDNRSGRRRRGASPTPYQPRCGGSSNRPFPSSSAVLCPGLCLLIYISGSKNFSTFAFQGGGDPVSSTFHQPRIDIAVFFFPGFLQAFLLSFLSVVRSFCFDSTFLYFLLINEAAARGEVAGSSSLCGWHDIWDMP